MELMEGGTLTHVLRTKELPWSVRLAMAEDIAKGIQVLHSSKPIVSNAKRIGTSSNKITSFTFIVSSAIPV
jgi:hypothetical protein